MKLKGKDLFVYQSSGASSAHTLIALSQSCTLNLTCNTVDKSSYLTGRAKSVRAGRYSWSVSSSSLINAESSDVNDLITKLINGTRLYIVFSSFNPSEPSDNLLAQGGYVLASDISIGGELNGMATLDITFTGDGALAPIEAPTE